jgi:hypothetical protein
VFLLAYVLTLYALLQLKQKQALQARPGRPEICEVLRVRQQQRAAASAQRKQEPIPTSAAGAVTDSHLEAELRAKEFEAMLLAEEEAAKVKNEQAREKVWPCVCICVCV